MSDTTAKSQTAKPKKGRPFSTAPRMIRCAVSMDQASIDKARLLGDGLVSLGVRRALAAYAVSPDTGPEEGRSQALPVSGEAPI